MSHCKKLISWRSLSLLIAFGMDLCLARPGLAGDYLLSAHGSATAGVSRTVTSTAGYGRGNCGHCHEMHASLEGDEPSPPILSEGASAYAVFAKNFDGRTVKPYSQDSNFCFYCHNSPGAAQTVTNYDYSSTFGGGSGGTATILAAFNQASYHNLNDIKTFVRGKSATYPWYTDSSNPCNACHNPHLAKRNQDSSLVGFPLNSAISKPSDHFNRWGETQTMATFAASNGGSYEAPYLIAPPGIATREPAGAGAADGSKTPDYAGFCTDCHTSDNNIPSSISTNPGGILRKINWTAGGEKHGAFARDGTDNFQKPYSDVASSKSNFVLSCLDCHEPHGSSNIMLIRRRVNGGDLAGAISSLAAMKPLCGRCHSVSWRTIHHDGTGAPYPGPPVNCTSGCHPGPPGSNPVPCGNCHFHGSDDSWLASVGRGSLRTYRKTF